MFSEALARVGIKWITVCSRHNSLQTIILTQEIRNGQINQRNNIKHALQQPVWQESMVIQYHKNLTVKSYSMPLHRQRSAFTCVCSHPYLHTHTHTYMTQTHLYKNVSESLFSTRILNAMVLPSFHTFWLQPKINCRAWVINRTFQWTTNSLVSRLWLITG